MLWESEQGGAFGLKPQDRFKHLEPGAREQKNDNPQKLCVLSILLAYLLSTKKTLGCLFFLINNNIIVVFIVIHYQRSPPSKIVRQYLFSTWNTTNKYTQIQRVTNLRKHENFRHQLHFCIQSNLFFFSGFVSLSRAAKKSFKWPVQFFFLCV